MFRNLTSAALLAIALMCGLAAAARGDVAASPGTLTAESTRELGRAVGNPDAGTGARIASVLGPEQIAAAAYRGTRAQRLVALEAARYLENPWPALPYLAALLRAEDRSTASQAAASLLDVLDGLAARPAAMDEVVPGQVAQLVRSLYETAAHDVVALDIRVSALIAVGALSEISGGSFPPESGLLESAEPQLASAAMALLAPPLGDEALASLAGIGEGAGDPALRGRAIGLLCENALHHRVAKPSDDLASLIRGVFDKNLPGEALLPALACLGRFPAEARGDLVDLALAHPDPAVKRFWEASSR